MGRTGRGSQERHGGAGELPPSFKVNFLKAEAVTGPRKIRVQIIGQHREIRIGLQMRPFQQRGKKGIKSRVAPDGIPKEREASLARRRGQTMGGKAEALRRIDNHTGYFFQERKVTEYGDTCNLS